jgi:hypothetical protein
VTANERARELLAKWYSCPDDHDVQEADITAAIEAAVAEAADAAEARVAELEGLYLGEQKLCREYHAKAHRLEAALHERIGMADEALLRAEKAEADKAMLLQTVEGLKQRAEKAEARVAKLTKACEEYAAALSRIDYLCEMKPNNMQVSGYDVHCNEKAVVEAVERVVARVAELEADFKQARSRWQASMLKVEAERNEARRERDEARRQRDEMQTDLQLTVTKDGEAYAAGWRAGRDAALSKIDAAPPCCHTRDAAEAIRNLEPGGGE